GRCARAGATDVPEPARGAPGGRWRSGEPHEDHHLHHEDRGFPPSRRGAPRDIPERAPGEHLDRGQKPVPPRLSDRSRRRGRGVTPTPKGQVTIVLALDEWMAMLGERGAAPHTLSETANVTLMSATPNGVGLTRAVTCSDTLARELLRWCEATAKRCVVGDPQAAPVLQRAARSINYALWRPDEEPPPASVPARRR